MTSTRSLTVFFLLLTLLFAHAEIRITLQVFSGIRNPTWILSPVQQIKVQNFLNEYTKFETYYQPTDHQLGYRGFLVSTPEITVNIYGYDEFERFLVATWAENVKPQVVEHIFSVMSNRVLIEAQNVPISLPEANDKCDIPVFGPDNSTIYSPQVENCGYFVRYQSSNNCYNYGNDIVTNSFAQPGRGTGHRWDYDTCDSVRAAAERDGLVWQGTALPTGQPANGHYVSLHIWPDTNFHWLRKDTNISNHWSHKPGGTAVRDVDNNGNKITDPSKADVSPWSQFCGYMISVPSKVTIN